MSSLKFKMSSDILLQNYRVTYAPLSRSQAKLVGRAQIIEWLATVVQTHRGAPPRSVHSKEWIAVHLLSPLLMAIVHPSRSTPMLERETSIAKAFSPTGFLQWSSWVPRGEFSKMRRSFCWCLICCQPSAGKSTLILSIQSKWRGGNFLPNGKLYVHNPLLAQGFWGHATFRDHESAPFGVLVSRKWKSFKFIPAEIVC